MKNKFKRRRTLNRSEFRHRIPPGIISISEGEFIDTNIINDRFKTPEEKNKYIKSLIRAMED